MLKYILFIIYTIVSMQATVFAQAPDYSPPSWWFGVAGAGNLNFYQGSTRQLNADFTTPVAFTKGFGAGEYIAGLVEYRKPNTMLGFILQAGYDNRMASFNDKTTVLRYPTSLNARINYITIEPSLRFAPFKSGFYLYGGPRVAFNMGKSFVFKRGFSPDFPNEAKFPDVKGDFSDINKNIYSMQVGAGYDLLHFGENQRTQFVIAPFVAYQPTFGQAPRSTES